MTSCCVNNRLQTRFLNGCILLILQIPSSAPLGNNQPCSNKYLDANKPFHWMYAICLSESYILDFLRLSLPGHDPLHPSSSGHTRHKSPAGMIWGSCYYKEITELYLSERRNHPAPLVQWHGRLSANTSLGNVVLKADNRRSEMQLEWVFAFQHWGWVTYKVSRSAVNPNWLVFSFRITHSEECYYVAIIKVNRTKPKFPNWINLGHAEFNKGSQVIFFAAELLRDLICWYT